MKQMKEPLDESRDTSSGEKSAAKDVRENGNTMSGTAEYEKKSEKHEEAQDWIDTVYSALKKVLGITFGVILLVSITRNDEKIATIKDFYEIALEHGDIGFLALVVAVFILARSIPLLIIEMKKTFKNDRV